MRQDPVTAIQAKPGPDFGAIHSDKPVTPAGQRPHGALADPPEGLDKAIEKINENAAAMNRAIRFEAVGHHRIVIKVVDNKTGDIIREIPPEAVVRATSETNDMVGLMMDQKA